MFLNQKWNKWSLFCITFEECLHWQHSEWWAQTENRKIICFYALCFSCSVFLRCQHILEKFSLKSQLWVDCPIQPVHQPRTFLPSCFQAEPLIPFVLPMCNFVTNSNFGACFDRCAKNKPQLMHPDQVNDLSRMHYKPPYPNQSPINDTKHVMDKHEEKKKHWTRETWIKFLLVCKTN